MSDPYREIGMDNDFTLDETPVRCGDESGELCASCGDRRDADGCGRELGLSAFRGKRAMGNLSEEAARALEEKMGAEPLLRIIAAGDDGTPVTSRDPLFLDAEQVYQSLSRIEERLAHFAPKSVERDGLPPSGKSVLAFLAFDNPSYDDWEIGTCDDGGAWSFGDEPLYPYRVTHYLPLPPKPL